MINRKFKTEFALHIIMDERYLVQQDSFKDIADLNFKPCIYMIGRRPKITINIDSIVITKDWINIQLLKQVKSSYKRLNLKIKNQFGRADIKILSEYPFTEYQLIDWNGDILNFGKVSLLLGILGTGQDSLLKNLDIELLYVGQSYGQDGNKTAVDRLKSHSTLQGIYSKAMNQFPDQEIWILLADLDYQWISAIDEVSENHGTTNVENEQHINVVLESEISEKQRICLTEAALIKYFKPDYNKTYKSSFPSINHQVYSECYDLDLNAIIVTLDTTDLMTRFWTSNILPRNIHHCIFPLHSRAERQFMLDFG